MSAAVAEAPRPGAEAETSCFDVYRDVYLKLKYAIKELKARGKSADALLPLVAARTAFLEAIARSAVPLSPEAEAWRPTGESLSVMFEDDLVSFSEGALEIAEMLDDLEETR